MLREQLADHFRSVHFGGNWTDVNLKDTLEDVDWKLATTKVHDLNTIAALVFHVNYYVGGVLDVLRGGPLTISDKYCFDVPEIASADDWNKLVNKTLTESEAFAKAIEQFDETRLFADFVDPKYGNYYKNLTGIVEHTHYHLGQISLIKKILKQQS